MKIESYEVERASSDAAEMAQDAAAIEIINRLGLKGQTQVLNPETATRNPFRRMTNLEMLVFGTLFTRRDKLEGYSADAIPLRVLELAAKAVDSRAFVKLEVWHDTERTDDPILVGVAGELKKENWGEYIRNEAHFLIARWGRALLPFEQLCAEAKAKWLAVTQSEKKRKLVELRGEITKLERDIETIQEDAQKAFTTGERPV